MGTASANLAEDLVFALRLADAADAISAAAFTGSALAHRLKPDGSPVSDTDEAVERRISELVAAERTGEGMLGEEVGESGPTARRWIVDGIDGTVLFVAGTRGWATQIALEVDGEAVIGVSASGADGHRWWASRGGGAWHAAPGRPVERLAVSDQRRIDGARYSLIPPLDMLGPGRRTAVDIAAAGVDATYVPPREHGALLVADGRIDACIQLGGGAWDFSALAVIVDEAGGRFSDLAGTPDVYGGGPVVYSNGHIHDELLAHLTSQSA